MPKRYRQEITRKELDSSFIPANHILVEMPLRSDEEQRTRAGIITGFRSDETFEHGEHAADTAQVYGKVVRVPERLYFNPDDENGMPWECDMEIGEDDIVFFSALESKNAVEIECESKVYKSIPYQDCYCAKREIWVDKWTQKKETIVIMLNGFILCEPVYLENVSALDVISQDKIDKSRGIVRFIGEPVKRYIREQYTDIADIQVGDLVQFDPQSPLYYLERNKFTSVFNDDKLYFVVQRRRISLILKRNGKKEAI
jgi:hypothetical protein